MEVDKKYLTFRHPFTALIAGMTGSGKTFLLRKILEDQNLTFSGFNGPLKVLWCYGQWQELYNQKIPGVNIIYLDGLPSKDDLSSIKPNLVILDDLMEELANSKSLANLFVKVSHHMNISVIFIVQNLFHQGSQMRTVSLNSHYMILMKNPRDQSQISHLARQLYPTNSKYFIEAFHDATSDRYGYLVVDMKQDTPTNLRVRTHVTKSIKGQFKPLIYTQK